MAKYNVYLTDTDAWTHTKILACDNPAEGLAEARRRLEGAGLELVPPLGLEVARGTLDMASRKLKRALAAIPHKANFVSADFAHKKLSQLGKKNKKAFMAAAKRKDRKGRAS